MPLGQKAERNRVYSWFGWDLLSSELASFSFLRLYSLVLVFLTKSKMTQTNSFGFSFS